MQQTNYQLYRSNIITLKGEEKGQFIKDGALIVKTMNNKSKIYKVGKYSDLKNICKNYEYFDFSDYILLPALYDMHFHWVQDDVRLMPKENLLDWLKNYTWPYEHKYRDKNFSKTKSKIFSQELASVGTIGGGCYGSIHGHTVDHALKNFKGDFIVGNVLMTMNSPDYLIQSKKSAVNLVNKKSTKYSHNYALTPRFAITTHPEVMKESASFAKANKSFIQTHLAETPGEIEFVMDIYSKLKGFEKVKSYTEVYKKSGLLGPRTIMGHGIYLNDDELEMIRKSKTKIAHCPSSNAPTKELGLGSGLFDFKRIEKASIDWALASDIGGGPYLSMFDVMDSFVRQNHKKKNYEASYTKALYRSTISAAKMLNISKNSGSLDSGKRANFIFIEAPKFKSADKCEDVLKRVIKKGLKNRANHDKSIFKTFLDGKEIYSAT